MTTDARRVPTLSELWGRVRLDTLERTEPGDVFYLMADPSRVYMREASRFLIESFLELGDEVWRAMQHVGTGNPAQVVVILHNTQKYCTSSPQEC